MASWLSSLSRLLGGKTRQQQSLLVHIKQRNDEHGQTSDARNSFSLEDKFVEALEEADAGELDGNEVGEGFFTIYMYGPGALRMWNAIAPVLGDLTAPVGSYVLKQYGMPGAREERIDLRNPAEQGSL